jgi:tetratricopeptide (TPR) repeat protein
LVRNKNVNAIRLIDSLLLNDPCNVDLLINKASYFNNIRETELALYYYLKVISLDKKNIIAFYNIATIYYNNALSYFTEEEPMSIERYRSKIIKAENDFKLSKMFFDKILELDSKNETVTQQIKELEKRTNCMDRIKLY